MSEILDLTFDFRTDTPAGKDPDSHSPTLRRYHHRLWHKRLPNGEHFFLSTETPRIYLHHKSEIGEFFLSSDGAVPSFANNRKMESIVSQISGEEVLAFQRSAYTIGGMMVFPSNRIDKKNTINGARGMHPQIADRFDLTVECIRRHYLGLESPLSVVLERYSAFFELFGDFRGYVNFFLLQDLVDNNYASVKFFSPFDGFDKSPLPSSIDSYLVYKKRASDFIVVRGQRMAE